jgi:adenylate cyclase
MPLSRWTVRHALWLVGVGPLVPMLLGSAVNIWYNVTHIQPLLTPAQLAAFLKAINIFNGVVYPVAVAIWVGVLLSLRAPFRDCRDGHPVAPDGMAAARRRVINLPWWAVALGGPGWFLCVPVFLLALWRAPGVLDPRVFLHLPISFAISAMIAITQGFFITEILSQRLLYPVFFQDAVPARTPGALALSLRGRGLLWAISAGVCPIGSLLLLLLIPGDQAGDVRGFALAVGTIGIVFGLVTAWLLGRLVAEPVDELRQAAHAVARGDLETRIDMLRADDFGPLIDEFNRMIVGLREKNRMEETFGRHVGQQVARQILQSHPGLGGVEEEVTVVFVDIRNFTARCAACPAEQIVSTLNIFLTEMVEVIEQRNGGIVNKFLGDGLMAIFASWTGRPDHADAAVSAGREMLARLDTVNAQLTALDQPPMAIGIGIHNGRAIVGSIGSPRRMEYTAIGDTVNVASRVEGLTKTVGEPLVMTAAARAALCSTVATEELPPQWVKGQAEPVVIYRLVK